MAARKIVEFPDPRLREKSQPVTVFDADLARLVDDMTESMAVAEGIGLAAVQIGVHKRVLILDLGDLDASDEYVGGDGESEKRLAERRTVSKIEVYINPQIVESDGEIVYQEGCLSVPGVYADVKRKEHLKLRYQDIHGKTHEIETEGLRSIAMQHEMDHLDGIVFPDHLSAVKRTMVMAKYKKLQREKELDAAEAKAGGSEDE